MVSHVDRHNPLKHQTLKPKTLLRTSLTGAFCMSKNNQAPADTNRKVFSCAYNRKRHPRREAQAAFSYLKWRPLQERVCGQVESPPTTFPDVFVSDEDRVILGDVLYFEELSSGRQCADRGDELPISEDIDRCIPIHKMPGLHIGLIVQLSVAQVMYEHPADLPVLPRHRFQTNWISPVVNDAAGDNEIDFDSDNRLRLSGQKQHFFFRVFVFHF